MAVVVHVRDREAAACRDEGVRLIGSVRAIAVARQNAEAARGSDDDIEVAVAIEVGYCVLAARRANAVDDRRGEGPVAEPELRTDAPVSRRDQVVPTVLVEIGDDHTASGGAVRVDEEWSLELWSRSDDAGGHRCRQN